jgi:hypothetical protein
MVQMLGFLHWTIRIMILHVHEYYIFYALQSYQSIRENDLSGEDVYNLLKHKKGEKLSMSQKSVLATHVKTSLEVLYEEDSYFLHFKIQW